MITRLHLVENIRYINKTTGDVKKVLSKIEIIFLGQNMYKIIATEYGHKDKLIRDTEIKYPALKGNGRKVYAKLRDMAMNITEYRDKNFDRTKINN